MRHIYW